MKSLTITLFLLASSSFGASSLVLDGFLNGQPINSTGRQWDTTCWTTVSSVHATPTYSVVSPQSYIVSTDQYVGGPYAAKCTGSWSVNGPTTYSGFALVTELGPGYTDLTWCQSVTFNFRASAACTIRINFNTPLISSYPVTWNGQWYGGGGNDDQYGYTFTVGTANAWMTIGVDLTSGISCQPWGNNSCPLVLSDGTTMSLSRAISNVTSIQWQTESPQISSSFPLTFWVDNVTLTAKSGQSAPVTYTRKSQAPPPWWYPKL